MEQLLRAGPWGSGMLTPLPQGRGNEVPGTDTGSGGDRALGRTRWSRVQSLGGKGGLEGSGRPHGARDGEGGRRPERPAARSPPAPGTFFSSMARSRKRRSQLESGVSFMPSGPRAAGRRRDRGGQTGSGAPRRARARAPGSGRRRRVTSSGGGGHVGACARARSRAREAAARPGECVLLRGRRVFRLEVQGGGRLPIPQNGRE